VSGVEAHHGADAYFSPEYETCRRVAEAAGVPLREVYQAAQQAWRSRKAAD
jgi:uncharacterized protein (DUF111 family)